MAPPTTESPTRALLKWLLRLIVFLVLWFASIVVLNGTGRMAGSVEVALLAVLVAAAMLAFALLQRRRAAAARRRQEEASRSHRR